MNNELTDKEKSLIRAALIGLPLSMVAAQATLDDLKEIDATPEAIKSIMTKLKL